MTTRDEYVASMKNQLDEWNNEIDTMEARAGAVQADLRMDFNKELAALRAQRDNGENKLEELKSSSEGAWDRVKLEAENLWDAFKASAVAFKAQYK